MNSIYTGIQEDIEKKILYGLSCEWDLVVNELEFKYSGRLKKPSFSIDHYKNILAQYKPSKNEIGFSRQFVMSCSWDSVREVLIHEIAHQFDFQIFNNNSKPHGDTFKTACGILKADPLASGNYKTLKEKITENGELSENDKLLIKVKKLMALAKSTNRNEAESAMAKAHCLIEKYNIDLINSSVKRNFNTIFIGKPSLRHFRETYYMTQLLTDFYYVEGIWVSSFVVEKGKMGKVFEISGTVQNLKITSYVNDFINRYIEMKWADYNTDKKLNRYRKTDFAIGIIEGFRTKLENKKTESNSDYTKSLIKIEDKDLFEYYNRRYPRQRTIQRKSSFHDKGIIDDGIKIGKKLIISEGIEEKIKNTNNLLT